MWLKGIWGELGQARRDYDNYCVNYNHIAIITCKKNAKPKKPPTFEQYAPDLLAFATGEQAASAHDMAQQTANMFGVPAHPKR